jgi:hypothetical protein
MSILQKTHLLPMASRRKKEPIEVNFSGIIRDTIKSALKARIDPGIIIREALLGMKPAIEAKLRAQKLAASRGR